MRLPTLNMCCTANLRWRGLQRKAEETDTGRIPEDNEQNMLQLDVAHFMIKLACLQNAPICEPAELMGGRSVPYNGLVLPKSEIPPEAEAVDLRCAVSRVIAVFEWLNSPVQVRRRLRQDTLQVYRASKQICFLLVAQLVVGHLWNTEVHLFQMDDLPVMLDAWYELETAGLDTKPINDFMMVVFGRLTRDRQFFRQLLQQASHSGARQPAPWLYKVLHFVHKIFCKSTNLDIVSSSRQICCLSCCMQSVHADSAVSYI